MKYQSLSFWKTKKNINLYSAEFAQPECGKGIQSTLFISNSKGPSETLRDTRTSTYQISELRKK